MRSGFWNAWLREKGRPEDAVLQLDLRDEAATARAAACLASLLRDRDVLALSGDLGAGKTTFVRALNLALGFPDEVSSPTFTLAMEHGAPASADAAAGAGPSALFHLDVYRLPDEKSFSEAGLDDYFARSGVMAIEWAERIAKLLPADSFILELTADAQNYDDGRRRLALSLPPERVEALGRAYERFNEN